MLSSRRDGDQGASHARGVWAAGGARRTAVACTHAFLSTGRAGERTRTRGGLVSGANHARVRRVVLRGRGRVMLVVMENHATQAQIDRVVGVIHVSKPYKQVYREWKQDNTRVTIAPGVTFGGEEIQIIAGPCSVESEQQIVAAAQAVRAAGATALRGGAFKPRSSPYSFQGMGKKGLELLALAREETGLAIVTEALDEEGAHLVAEYADCIQIGARNMQNYSLLRSVGRIGKPVLLKRGMAATITDLLLSAEYILAEGNGQIGRATCRDRGYV